MAVLNLSNSHGVNVTYRTDLLKGNNGNFTVMSISDMSDSEIEHGLDFQLLVHDLGEFVNFTKAHNLKLTRTDSDNTITTYDYTDESDSGSIFI